MASLKALAARLASQACDHIALPARAAVTLQYVFLRPTRDGAPASASLHASWDSGGDQIVTGMRGHRHAPPRSLHNAPPQLPRPVQLAEPVSGLSLLPAVILASPEAPPRRRAHHRVPGAPWPGFPPT